MQIAALGLAGMQRAEQRLNQTAAALSKPADPAGGSDQVDLSAEMVSLLAAKESFSASTKLAATEAEFSNAIVDLLG